MIGRCWLCLTCLKIDKLAENRLSLSRHLFDGQKLADEHHKTCQHLTALQSMFLDEHLIAWKRSQQLAGNGAAFDGSLDTLQQWWVAYVTWHWPLSVYSVVLEWFVGNGEDWYVVTWLALGERVISLINLVPDYPQYPETRAIKWLVVIVVTHNK